MIVTVVVRNSDTDTWLGDAFGKYGPCPINTTASTSCTLCIHVSLRAKLGKGDSGYLLAYIEISSLIDTSRDSSRGQDIIQTYTK